MSHEELFYEEDEDEEEEEEEDDDNDDEDLDNIEGDEQATRVG